MKKVVSAILALLLILGGLPVSAESSQTAVEIPCEYVIENRIYHGSVAGIVDNGLAYVSLETAAELSGTTMLEEGEFCHFISERLWNLWSLELSSGTLTEESVYYDKRSWEIPTLSVDGDTLVSLEHMLCAMGCRYSWNAGEEYPLSIYKPYTYFDALHEVNKESVFFEWAELGSAGGNEKLYYMLSAFYSLIMDYNSHLISDVLFSWIADDILNAPEEQWRDAMYTVLTCLEGADLGSVNSEAIESLELEGDGLSLGLDTLELMGITGGELEKIGGALDHTAENPGCLPDFPEGERRTGGYAQGRISYRAERELSGRRGGGAPETGGPEPAKPDRRGCRSLDIGCGCCVCHKNSYDDCG